MTEKGQRPNAVILADVQPERLDFLSPGRVAAGKLSVLDGDPGDGKSTLTIDWGARVTRGHALPGGVPRRPCGVVVMSAEDGIGDTILPRFNAAGADLSKVIALVSVPDGTPEGRFPAIPDDLDYVREAIEAVDAGLLIIDPLMAYLSAELNSNRDQDVRRALAAVAALAEELSVAVVITRHLNKQQHANALYRGGGSVGIIGAARCGLLLARDPDDSERRILASTKCNLAVPPQAITYRLRSAPGTDVAVLVEEGASSHTASSLLAVGNADEEGKSARHEVENWLRDLLLLGPVAARDIRRKAREDGISERTLDRAKESLGVRSSRVGGIGAGGAWSWTLPEHLHTLSPPTRSETAKDATKHANEFTSGVLSKTVEIPGLSDPTGPKNANVPVVGGLSVSAAAPTPINRRTATIPEDDGWEAI